MALTDTFPTQDAAGLSITDTRLVMAGLVAQNADGTPRPGVLAAGTAPLVTGKASMAYDVAPFKAALSRLAGGVELVANDAMASVATTAAPAANSRLDVIYVRSRFTQHADGSNVPEFGVAKGTAAATPTKPAIPAGALELATAEILSTTTTTATAVITQSAPFTAAAGGVVPLRSQVEQAAYTPAGGTLAWRADLQQLLVYASGAIIPGWFPAGGRPSATALTLTGIYLAGNPTPRIVEQGGRIILDGIVTSGTANFVAGTNYTIGSVPTDKAPATVQKFACTSNGTAIAAVTIDTGGTITIILNSGFTGALLLSLGGCSWPDKAL